MLTPEEHRARHQELHRKFDELIADYMDHHLEREGRFLDVTVGELMEWSHAQTKNPTYSPNERMAVDGR